MAETQRELLSKLPKEKLLDYVEMLHKNFWTLQNTWMLHVNKKYGQEAAEEFDSLVMGHTCEVEIYRAKKFLDLGNDFTALKTAYDYSNLGMDMDYEWEIGDDKAVMRVTRCGMQLGRRKSDLPELPCKEIGFKVWPPITGVIDPKIKTSCVICPPDPHPEDLWCEWEFRFED